MGQTITVPLEELMPPPAAAGASHLSAAIPGTALSTDAAGQRANLDIAHGAIGPKARQLLDEPLAHPTGVDALDSLTSPKNLTLTALSGLALQRAAAVPAGNALAQAKAAVAAVGAQASTQIKYEVTKSALQALHVPAGIAIPLAIVVSGYKRSATAAPEATPATSAAPVETPPAAAPPVPTSAPAAGASPPAALGKVLKTLQTEGGLSPAEANQALKWLKQGVDVETVHARIEQAWRLQKTGAFAKLPTADEVAAAVKARNETGRWPGE